MFDPNDTSHDTIKKLFQQQIRRITKQACGIDTFDVQFSDAWINS